MSKKSVDLEYMQSVVVKTGLRAGIVGVFLYGFPPHLLYGVPPAVE